MTLTSHRCRHDAKARFLYVALGPLGAASVAIGAQELIWHAGGVGPKLGFLSKSGGKFIVRRRDEALVALVVAPGSLGAAALHVGAADAVLPGAAPPDVLAAAAVAARLLLRAGRRRVASVGSLLNLVEGDHVNHFPLRAIPKCKTEPRDRIRRRSRFFQHGSGDLPYFLDRVKAEVWGFPQHRHELKQNSFTIFTK